MVSAATQRIGQRPRRCRALDGSAAVELICLVAPEWDAAWKIQSAHPQVSIPSLPPELSAQSAAPEFASRQHRTCPWTKVTQTAVGPGYLAASVSTLWR